MAFADYFDRGAVAAAQVIAGFDEEAFKEVLSGTAVGVSLGAELADASEGRLSAEMTVRLLARLYPRLAITAAPAVSTVADELRELARRINPAIEVTDDDDAPIGLVIGSGPNHFATPVFIGSKGWLALVSSSEPRPIGTTDNPFGAGAAACFGCANVFRHLFLGGSDQLDADIVYSTYTGDLAVLDSPQPGLPGELPDRTVLVGCGAIGNGAAWALANSSIHGELNLVDRETIELSNLQRYVLAERRNVDGVKVDVVADMFKNGISAFPHNAAWADFVAGAGYNWRYALVALDSAADRRAVQGSLPENIVNAWTQPGDLGVSVHGRMTGRGSCLSCLYLPSGQTKNEDELVAEALGVPEFQQQIRHLLYAGGPLPAEILDVVADRLSVERDTLALFADRPVRELYVEGLCGGAVLPLDRLHGPQQEVHVPLAHQSALAGIQLAAAFAGQLCDRRQQETRITRIDVLRPIGTDLSQPSRKSDPRCVCADADFAARYDEKWRPRRAKRAWKTATS
jgi:hypothetical protein